MNRCPECGRPFAPGNPASFSATPRPERFNALVRQASVLLSDALATLEPADPVARAVRPLRRQVARLSAENAALRQHLTAVTRLLIDGGVLDPDALAAAVAANDADGDVEIVDDTAEAEPVDDADEVDVNLVELRQAVERHGG